jgi:uncharacterized repeat protein (TIGR03943 family)
MKKLLPYLTILLFGLYGVKLFLLRQFAFYINRNNIWYTALGFVVCFIIGCIGIVYVLRKKSPAQQVFRISMKKAVIYLPLLIALVVGFFIPSKPLTGTSFAQDLIIIKPPAKGATDAQIEHMYGFTTADYPLYVWMNIQSMSPHYQYLDGKSIDLTGQIYSTGTSSFVFGRLYITCCAVDARPFGYTVNYLSAKGAQNPYHAGEWVAVNGIFSVDKKNDTVSIVPLSIKQTTQPVNPYAN